MKIKIVILMLMCFGFSTAPGAANAQGNERQKSIPSASPTPLNVVEAEKKSWWRVHVISVEKIQPGTENEPRVNQSETLLKLGIKFEYSGPDGEVPAPVAQIIEGTGKEHIMLGNLQASEGFDCFSWIISASHAVFNEKPKSLPSTTIAKCKDAVFHYYFLLPENPKEPLALVFGDAKPLPVVWK